MEWFITDMMEMKMSKIATAKTIHKIIKNASKGVPNGLEGEEARVFFETITTNYSEENIVKILRENGMSSSVMCNPQMKALLHFITMCEYDKNRAKETIKEQHEFIDLATKKVRTLEEDIAKYQDMKKANVEYIGILENENIDLKKEIANRDILKKENGYYDCEMRGMKL